MLFIANGKVITMEGTKFERASILVKDGKIVEIGESLQAPEGAKIIDATGKTVVPGLIDAHTHLGLSGTAIRWEGNDHNEIADPVTPHMRTIDAINIFDETFRDAIESGVTCVATSPGSANVVGGQLTLMKTGGSTNVDDLAIKAPLAMKCALGENPKNLYGQMKKVSPFTRMATAAILRETFLKAKEYLSKKEIAENPDNPENNSKKPDFNMKYDALIPVIKKEIPIHIHAHQANDIHTAIRLAKELDIECVIVHATDGHLISKEMVKSGFSAIIGPTMGHKSKPEVKNKTFETINVLNQAGVPVCITTDHPVIPLQHLNICAALAVQAGMEREEALKAITIYPAKILNLDNRVGSLACGKDADIVIWDGCPLDATSLVLTTIINGEVLYQR
ncbi:MAG: amidohydrolase [Defluviitaleaceae bacterium]|nr:amidohydrolase [Defluviitaleaceae bacterium]